jgi:hypothetical protein
MPSCLARHSLNPVGDVQLAADASRVGFDSTRGHNKLAGDLLVGLAQGLETENLQLTLAQWLDQITGWGGFFPGCRIHMRFGVKLGEQAEGTVPRRAASSDSD